MQRPKSLLGKHEDFQEAFKLTLTADLSGKRAFVTGASSGGLGRYFSKVLAKAGAEVCVSARRLEPLNELVDEIRQDGGQATAVKLDVSVANDVDALFETTEPFDIIVNNAGVDVTKPILDQTERDFDHVLGINLKGVWNVGNAAARSIKKAGMAGSIINIASITGLRQIGHLSTYAVSKSAVIQLTKQMALELARYNIRANAIAPGYFESDMTRDFFESSVGKDLIKRVPMRRLGDYESLAGVLLLLASDASSFITGSIIPVDGGHLVSSL